MSKELEIVPPLEMREPTQEQVEILERAIKAGCTDDEACAFAGIRRRDYMHWLGKKLQNEPTWLDDLHDLIPRREAARKVYEARVADKLTDIVDSQLQDALTAEEGSVRNAARKDILDRVIGRPQERIDHTTQGEKLNERITKLDDAQLEQLIASVQGGTRGTTLGEAEAAP